MPSEKYVFTTRVEPISSPYSIAGMVETPSTAPGSTTIIPRTVYRHSWQASTANIGDNAAEW